MKLDSGWELAYVLYCLDHNISITRNVKKFPYIYRGRTYGYIPDFICDGQYVEIKGRETQRTFAKYRHFPHPLTILRRDDLKHVFAHVLEKYGKEYWRLFE
jgi:hypothetical protein